METNERWSHLFKALGEPIRLRMLHLFRETQELCVCDFVTILGISQSTISRHLAYLRYAGWVDSRRSGIWIHYRINQTNDPLQTEIIATLFQQGHLDATMQQDLIKLKHITTSPNRC